ncbi:GTPase-activating protein [Venturia nashicola]|uniref:GTPase-activating protein n=1 Tax=Venturia nashicola TaxID=86259 RepID=A0A4Z1P1C7_9PEZI|nr:GTPase-activating protein [Venturia nashicola]
MAAKVAMAFSGPDISEATELMQTLQTTKFELDFERSSRIVEGVAKDEDIRKLRFKIAVMEDEIEELNEQLAKEEERADLVAQDLEDAVAQTGELDATVQQLSHELRMKTRDLEAAEAEVSVMNTFSNDSAKVLREKLALARELGNLKPEVEHLRSQVASNQVLLAEKLSLQRQLGTIQVELENAKRTAERAFAKSGKSGEQHAQYEAQIEVLQKELREAKQTAKDHSEEVEALKQELKTIKKAAKRAEAKDSASEEAEIKLTSQVEELRKELIAEKKERQQAEKAATRLVSTAEAVDKTKAQLDEVRKELAAEKKERQRAEKAALKDTFAGEVNEKVKAQLEELRKELATEKKERQRAEKAIEKETAAGEAQRATLEDKLATFRTKLKATKEKLKEKEVELQKAELAAATNSEGATKAKNPRKRPIAQMDPDAAIGTPGDAVAAKRGKRSFSVAPGDKSTFSITPFLNRTMSLAPEGPDSDEEQVEKEVAPAIESEAEAEASPIIPTKKARKEKAPPKPHIKPLAPASTDKQNTKPKPKRSKSVVPTLEKVIEEEENASQKRPTPIPTEEAEIEDNDHHPPRPTQAAKYKETTTTTKVALTLKPKTNSLKDKPRKSLMSFATFTDEQAPEKKKKRKLLGNSSSGLGKTLFDEDDDDKVAAKPVPGRGLFKARGLAGGAGAFGPKKGLVQKVVLQDEGFQFSPLKKDRKAMALAQSMIGD